MKTLNLYTDGACSGNQNNSNIGGWGCILEYGSSTKELYGGCIDTTNNRMELTAVIEGFKALTKDNLTIRVFTDSAYVANCFRENWHVSWLKNGWKTSGKKEVLNRDLWETLIELTQKHSTRFFRVKGHVNLESKTANLDKLYSQFTKWNGSSFSFDDFKYITEMNILADKLANKGIESNRPTESIEV